MKQHPLSPSEFPVTGNHQLGCLSDLTCPLALLDGLVHVFPERVLQPYQGHQNQVLLQLISRDPEELLLLAFAPPALQF